MTESFIMYTINILYFVGIISILISVLAYLYLPKALNILFEEEEEGDKNE
jgi:hypothetical protein